MKEKVTENKIFSNIWGNRIFKTWTSPWKL